MTAPYAGFEADTITESVLARAVYDSARRGRLFASPKNSKSPRSCGRGHLALQQEVQVRILLGTLSDACSQSLQRGWNQGSGAGAATGKSGGKDQDLFW